jgi:hypothetical protein
MAIFIERTCDECGREQQLYECLLYAAGNLQRVSFGVEVEPGLKRRRGEAMRLVFSKRRGGAQLSGRKVEGSGTASAIRSR